MFGTPVDMSMVKVTPPPITRDYHQAAAGEWGYSLLARSSVGGIARTALVDFGYSQARERKDGGVVLSSYMLAATEEIGQDRANDVSHIAAVRERPDGEPLIRPIAENLRVFHEHAVALAAAYGFAEGKDAVLWKTHRKYSWA